MMYFRFFRLIIFCTLASSGFILGTSVDGTSNVRYLTENHVFRNNEYARGYVKFNDGATILSDATASFNILSPLSGGFDLRGTGTLTLEGNLILDVNATISGNGVIRGNGNTIFLKGDLYIPNNSIIHIDSDTTIDGQGHELFFENRGRIFVDTNVTLTLQNMRIIQNLNDYSDPCIRLAAFKSSLALKDVELALSQDFLFSQGQLFIHGDVIVTGTSAFIYQSTQKSLIAHDSSLCFDIGTTFSVIPATITDCKFDQWPTYTSNSFILMADKTSVLHFNQATLCATPTGCRFSNGSVNLENKCFVKSNSALDLPRPYFTNMNQNINTGNLPTSVAYSPDGSYLAVVNKQSNTLQIFDSVLYTQIGSDVVTGNLPIGVSWSNTSTQLAVINSGDNAIKVFNFNGSTTPSLSASTSTGNSPSCVAWSNYGKYIAVTNSGSDTLQIFKADTLAQVGSSIATDNTPSSVSWAPGDKYLAVTNYDSNSLQIFSFDYLNTPVLEATGVTEYAPGSVSWAQNGLFIAVANKISNSLQIFTYNSLATLELEQTLPTNYNANSVAWSPDTKYTAITNYYSHAIQLFSFLDLSQITQITEIVSSLEPISFSWSPNHNYLVGTYSPEFSLTWLRVFEFDGISLNLIDEINESSGEFKRVKWSNDEEALAVTYVDGFGSEYLRVYGFDGSSIITPPDSVLTGNSLSSISWSPTEGYISVASLASNKLDVYPFTISGLGDPYTYLVSASEQLSEAVFDPSGKYIASGYSNSDDFTLGLHIFLFNGSSITDPYPTLTNFAIELVSWSPDGRFIATAGEGSLQIFYFNGFEAPTPIGTAVRIDDFTNSISWSKDGRFISVSAVHTAITQLYSFNGYSSPQSVGIPLSCGGDTDWSADSQFIAIADRGDNYLKIFSVNSFLSLESSNISAQTGAFPSSLSWHNDSSKIAVSSENLNMIEQFEFNENAPVSQVGDDIVDGGDFFSWSPCGKYLAVVYYDSGLGTNLLRIYPFNGYNIQAPYEKDTEIASLALSVKWSPDGKFVSVNNYIFPFNGSVINDRIPDASVSGQIIWSPDGKFIATYFGTLNIFNFTGYSVGASYSTPDYCLSLDWSPDGRFIAATASAGNAWALRIFSFNGTSNPIQIGSDVALSYGYAEIKWSPDGRFIAAWGQSGILQVFSFNGIDTPIQVGNIVFTEIGSIDRPISWSPDGKFLANCNADSGLLHILSFDGANAPTNIGTAFETQTTNGGVSWSKDGQFIAAGAEPIRIYKVNYKQDQSKQAISNGVVFGHASLGSNYDTTINVLAGANVLVDGLINYDCVN